MRTLGPTDPVRPDVTRILVAGTAGAGKTTLAGHIGETLQIPHTELDNLYWGPGWTTRESFLPDVEELVASEAWVTEWQYRAVRPLTGARAQLMVWLDLPVRVRMHRVTRRTLIRRLKREAVWDSKNVEPPLRTVLSKEDHILRWAWDRRHSLDDLPERLAAELPHLDLVRLSSPADVRTWLRTLASSR
ncbi:adenylate kinase [Georgenia halophila]|uniref:Adenylate kinase n=1 Tax=Georgenia halophila TaxID=620889 RepID=A0ABP8LJB3_9MICO